LRALCTDKNKEDNKRGICKKNNLQILFYNKVESEKSKLKIYNGEFDPGSG